MERRNDAVLYLLLVGGHSIHIEQVEIYTPSITAIQVTAHSARRH
jgi:hypothetical protein